MGTKLTSLQIGWARVRAWLHDDGRDALRGWPLLALFAVTFTVVLFLNPAKAGLTLFGISKIALGGYLGYLCDRHGFRKEDRPHVLEGVSKGTAWKRRAIIMAAAIVAAALIP
jgi:hypothetical protein